MVELYDSDLPLVVIDFEDERVCNITANNQQGVYLAVDEFIRNGHTKIADIHGGRNTFIGGVRKKAFEDAMANHGYDVPDRFSVEGEYFSKDEGYEAMQHLLNMEDGPTAVFCASDMMAIGAIQAIRDAGKHVPDDVSVIGFDGIEMGQILSPRLTTFRQNTEKMGEIAGKRLLAMIEERKRLNGCRSIVVDGDLIDGETVKECRE
jgi:LacI family transcriptional regulator